MIAGLGNPGSRYKNTRHNIGFKVINLWGKFLGVHFNGRRFQSRNARARLLGREIILIRPVTFMNQSGKSIKACVDFYHLKTENILVIHDDVDLQVGKIKVVRNGGAGGHKGVLSVIQHLGSREFPRVKIGIGRPCFSESIEDYVLSSFYRDEKEIMEKVIEIGLRACELVISNGVESAMNVINGKNFTHKEVSSLCRD